MDTEPTTLRHHKERKVSDGTKEDKVRNTPDSTNLTLGQWVKTRSVVEAPRV